ncbi:PCNA-associated factor [Prinia subflava]|uniref:PCNA-associated factor n=1 Tax=Prinia subflava TaxID=208062 RepID=UPI002FE27675
MLRPLCQRPSPLTGSFPSLPAGAALGGKGSGRRAAPLPWRAAALRGGAGTAGMARTKVDQRGRAFRKVLVARAPRKALGSGSINARPPLPSPRGDRRPVGLNRVCVRPVPAWQRGISDFLKRPAKENRVPDGEMPGTSSLEAQTLPLDPAEDGECLEEEEM